MKRYTWLLLAFVAGCCCPSRQAATAPAAAPSVTPGYALLYHLMSQERNVSDLLIIKHADVPIPALIKEIAAAADTATGKLQDFAHQDPGLNLKDTSLPEIENRARYTIKGTQTHDLLFSSGRTFDTRLLFTQADGMNYAAHLAGVINETEKDPARKQFLAHVQKTSIDFYYRILALLASGPNK